MHRDADIICRRETQLLTIAIIRAMFPNGKGNCLRLFIQKPLPEFMCHVFDRLFYAKLEVSMQTPVVVKVCR
jgi:hypothetical protein